MIYAIPYNIPSQNVVCRRNWRANHRDVVTIQSCARMFAKGACNATGPRALKIMSYRKQKITDISNLIGGSKFFTDGLVRAGVLVDDNDKMAKITYGQRVISELPDDLVSRFGRIPLTTFEIEDL